MVQLYFDGRVAAEAALSHMAVPARSKRTSFIANNDAGRFFTSVLLISNPSFRGADNSLGSRCRAVDDRSNNLVRKREGRGGRVRQICQYRDVEQHVVRPRCFRIAG